MITETDSQHWTPDHSRPYVDHAVERFGLKRLMFGGEWQVNYDTEKDSYAL
jgi:L-fuconolactonase